MTIRGRYEAGRIALTQPLELPEGAEVEILVRLVDDERTEWEQLGAERLEAEWDNPEDAIYDNWRSIYGVSES